MTQTTLNICCLERREINKQTIATMALFKKGY
jgi:hypothetical protein